MTNTKNSTTIRIGQRVIAKVRAYAMANGVSLSDSLASIVNAHEELSPVKFVIRRCKTRALGDFFTTTIGEGATDVYEGKSEDEAYEAVLTKIRELGLSYRDVEIEKRTETLDADKEVKAA